MNTPSNDPNVRTDPATRALQARLYQQELLADLGGLALKRIALSELFDRVARTTAVGMGCEMCKIMEYIPLENRFLVRAGVGWHPGVIGHATVGADLASPAGYALHTGMPVISNDLRKETRFRTPQLLLEHGARRAVNVLLQGENTPYGVLEVDSSEDGEFSQHDVDFLQGVANLVGLAIERQRFEQSLKGALERQALLLDEVNHRVKNSLQLVAGLLLLQGRGTNQSEIREQLERASKRVTAVARAHHLLYGGEGISNVDLSNYLGTICRDLVESVANCDVRIDAPERIDISIDRAIPIALLVNEIATNAAKYAYANTGGTIWVQLRREGENIHLSVRDDGIGLPDGFDMTASSGLGMRIVMSFVQQLGASVTHRRRQPGTEFAFAIPSRPQG